MDKVSLGLKENWKQFTLLVIVNAFVGGMIGLERTIIPQIAEADFGMAARTAILSFIVVFGVTKAITNYYKEPIGRRLVLCIASTYSSYLRTQLELDYCCQLFSRN